VNSQEGVTYEEALSSDEDEGIIHNNNLVDSTKCVLVSLDKACLRLKFMIKFVFSILPLL
jgi:hypothetical protein